jgi:Mlc titration factor MtfA (ptsG expression regulator)
VLGWLRSRRRQAIQERPVPAAWREILRKGVRQTDWLDEDQAARLLGWIAVFLEEKRFEGCRGFDITDEVRVVIAAQAGLVVLGFPDLWLDGLKSVLVYPGDYLVPRSMPLTGGGELEWQEARLGETWGGGSMVLSWPGARAAVFSAASSGPVRRVRTCVSVMAIQLIFYRRSEIGGQRSEASGLKT